MIAFQLSADTARFTKGMQEALQLMEGFTRAAEHTQQAAEQFTLEAPQTAVGEKGAPGEAGAGQAASGVQAQAAMIHAALQSALAPIGQIEARMAEMSNRAGGALVTMARRIDDAMKFPVVLTAIDKLNAAVDSPFKALNSAIAGFEGRINVFGGAGAMFDRLGAKVVSLANLIDQKFRFDNALTSFNKFVWKAADQLDVGMGYGVAAVVSGLGSIGIILGGKVLPMVVRFASSASSALARVPLDMIKDFARVQNFFAKWGDVAKKSLSQLFNFRLGRPIAETQKFTSALGGVSTVATKAGTSVKQFGGQVAIALGVFGLGYKAVDFFKQGLVGASDLNETINKTGVIFDAQASVVTKAADDMASRFGMVKGEFMDAASTFGQLLQGMGLQSQKASATTSVQLAKLAADASSIFNTTFEEASGKIASALRGQSEPISAFGIDVQEAATKAEAARMGIASLKGELTTSQKVAARTSLIMRGLAVAQGDLENTADEPANAMRRFQGTMTNLANSVGEMFMPAMKVGLGAANDFAQMLTSGFESSKGVFESFSASISAGFSKIGVVIRNFPLMWDIAVLKFREGALNLIATLGVLPANLAIVAGYIAGNWRQLITDAVNAVGAAFQNLGTNIGELANSIYQFLKDPTQGFQFNWKPLLDGFKATAAQLPELIKPELVSMQKEIDSKWAEIARNEAARAERLKKNQPAQRQFQREPGEKEDKKKKKGKQDTTAGAFVLGSQEAASAIAQYANRNSKDGTAKKTEANTAQAAKILQRIENKLPPAVRAGQPMIAKGF